MIVRKLPMSAMVMAVSLLLLTAGSAFAQLQTGNLYGTVTDNQGEALPGVTVTLAGKGAPQVQVTNADGQYRFLSLSPGRYELTAELEAQQPEDAAGEVLAALGGAARAEGFRAEVANAVRRAQAEIGDGTLGAWLDELELRAQWEEATVRPLGDQLRRIVGSDAFGEWWSAQFED